VKYGPAKERDIHLLNGKMIKFFFMVDKGKIKH